MGIFDVIFSMAGKQSAANIRGRMDDLEKFYGKQTFILYGLFAQVPGRSAIPRFIFVPFSMLLFFLATIYQILKLVKEKFQLQFIIDLLPTIAATFGILLYVPYVAFSTGQEYKDLLSIMSNDLKEKRPEQENEIKRKYSRQARLFVNVFSLLLSLSVFGLILSSFSPRFLDLIIPLNESRQIVLLVNGELFIDQQKYFCYIYVGQYCIASIMAIVIGVSENMSVIIGQHACGMGAVIGYQLENLTRAGDNKELDDVNRVELVTSRLRRIIEDHQKLLRFALLIAAFYDIPLTLVLVGTFGALTVSLVQVTDPELISAKAILFSVCQVFQLFLVSYMGQTGTDSSVQLAKNAYNAKWYICSPDTRRMLQLVILRSSKPILVVARNMYALSIENFMAVIQTVLSCYMVLRQSR